MVSKRWTIESTLGRNERTFHTNLLRRYFERDEVHKKAAVMTVIDEDDSVGDGVTSEDPLQHLPT